MIQHHDFNSCFVHIYDTTIIIQFIQEDLFYISGDISGSPTSYIAHASNLVTTTAFNSTVELSSCEEGSGCPIEITDSSYCPQSTIINVTISAANRLGEGPRSNPHLIGIIINMRNYSRC